MTITYEGTGDIFQSPMQTIVCPVNCVGVMGAGLALAFKRRFDGLFKGYWNAIQDGGMSLKRPYLHRVSDTKNVLCFATKADWRAPSELKYLKMGLAYLVKHYEEMGITSLSFPQVGCGLGGLDYHQDVRPLLYAELGPLPIPVELTWPG